jgi:hypothetical protein
MRRSPVIARIGLSVMIGLAACGGAERNRAVRGGKAESPPAVHSVFRDPDGAYSLKEIPPYRITGDSRFPILVSDSRSWQIDLDEVLDKFRDTETAWAGVGQARLMRMADGPDGTRYTGEVISLKSFPHPTLKAWELHLEEISEFWGNGPNIVETAPLGPVYILEIPGRPRPSMLFFTPIDRAIVDTRVYGVRIDSIVASVRAGT